MVRKEMSCQTGEELRDQGMKLALDNANEKTENWYDKAYNRVVEHSKKESEFMVEDVREAARGILAEPPSNRAWGLVVRKAKSNNVIKWVRYDKVKNPKAHCTPASVWEAV
jgi:hypothetical protein